MSTCRRSSLRCRRRRLPGHRASVALPCAMLWLLCATAEVARAELFAGQLTSENLVARRTHGPDADAGLGDWVLGNGTLCAAVAGADHEMHLSMAGGSLIDVALCQAGGDQWSALQPLLNLGMDWQIPIREIRAEQDGAEARIVSVADGDGLRLTTVHTVSQARPRELRVRLSVERTGDGPRLFAIGAVALHSGAQLRPFTLSLQAPERSIGFVRPHVDTGSPLTLVRALVAADAYVLVGGDLISPGISYGIRTLDPTFTDRDALRSSSGRLAVGGYDFTLMGATSRPWWFGSAEPPGLWQLAQIPFMNLQEGQTIEQELWISIGLRADVASVTDDFWPDAPTVRGQLDDPEARVHLDTEAGVPVTEARSDAEGRLRFRVPEGRYRVRARAPGGREIHTELRVGPEGGDLGRLAVGAPARLLLPRGQAFRLQFRGEQGTPDPHFGRDLLGFRLGEREILAGPETSTVSLAGVASDPSQVTLAPGHYRVLATRGIEFDVTQTRFEVIAGSEQTLEIAPPKRAVATPGWIGADLHVHTIHSFDSAWPVTEQVRAFAAQGIEVLVATDHDRVFDPRPTIEAMGLGHRMLGVSGVEITSAVPGGESPYTIGHSNAFPLAEQRDRYRGGAPRAEGLRLRDVAAALRAMDPRPIFQLNHPRSSDGEPGDLYYFSHLGVVGEPFDPARTLASAPNSVLLEADPEHGLRDLDFDAMELLNGTESGRYPLLRADWVSLLLQGERKTATANSDSHTAGQLPGLPRNLVRVEDDDPARLDPGDLFASVRAGRVVGTTGPILDAHLGTAGVGDTFQGREGTLEIALRVAPWVPVREVRVLVNGEIAERFEVSGDADLSLPLHFERDGFVVVEAEGPAEGRYADLLPGMYPLAFTNPILVDADGDGRLVPAGLSQPLPWALGPGREALP